MPAEGAPRRRPSSRRRRRRRGRALGRWLAGVAPLLALIAAGALWLADDPGRPRTAAVGAPAPASAVANAPPAAPQLIPGAVSLEGPDSFRLAFKQPPRAALVFDLGSGRVLWRRQPLRRMPVASLTKIMTALVVVDRSRPRDQVRITRAALRYSGSGVGLLPKGRHVSVESLLHGLLLVSGNDAAIALADHVAGSERRFVRLMNARARALGLGCTRFVSAHGLERGNRSCAVDLAAMARLAMGQRRIARVVRKRSADVRFPIKGGRLYLNSTNPLLRARYPGAIGLKTGYTEDAGRSFVGVVRRGRRRLGVVLLHSPDPARQARKLIGTAFREG